MHPYSPSTALRLSTVRCFSSVHLLGENAYQIGEPIQNCPSPCEGVKGVKGGFETILFLKVWIIYLITILRHQ